MKKILAASVSMLAAFVIVPTAQALTHSQAVAYGRAYAHVVHVFGRQTAGCRLIGSRATCRHASDAMVLASTRTLHRMLAPSPPPPPPSTVTGTSTAAPAAAVSAASSSVPASSGSYVASSGGGYANVPGVPSGFAACVAMRESTDGAGSSNIYGIVGPGGQGSLVEQKQAFAHMYAERGTQPWAPWDGC